MIGFDSRTRMGARKRCQYIGLVIIVTAAMSLGACTLGKGKQFVSATVTVEMLAAVTGQNNVVLRVPGASVKLYLSSNIDGSSPVFQGTTNAVGQVTFDHLNKAVGAYIVVAYSRLLYGSQIRGQERGAIPVGNENGPYDTGIRGQMSTNVTGPTP